VVGARSHGHRGDYRIEFDDHINDYNDDYDNRSAYDRGADERPSPAHHHSPELCEQRW